MQSTKKYTRSAGVLLPVTTLHGPFGIGVLGPEAYEFIDFLSIAGFRAWQILPVEHTAMCSSPYKCVSAFAGEPMLIDPRALLEMELITEEELSERAEGLSEHWVDYELVREKQLILLKAAYSRLNGSRPHARFKRDWLENYSMYMAIKDSCDGMPWYDWPDMDIRRYKKTALTRIKKELSGEIDFYKFVQWLFHEQWNKLRKYAGERGVSLIGDMPIYVSEDSAVVWGKRELFDVDPEGNFTAVSGVPPDYFNPDGQLWGNPIYNWKLMKKEGFTWWISRLKAATERYDLVRLDHFRGFESYWRIPASSTTAKKGRWVKGPGMSLFKAMQAALGNLPVIAEDLGDIDSGVERLLKRTDFRGMRVLQFSFLGDDYHLPHNYTQFDVAYTGTHDNTTLLAWMFELDPEIREQALDYIDFVGDWTVGGPNCAINKAWIRALLMSGASIAVVPIQDLLGYGADTRTNIPGTAEGNWRFRIGAGALGQIDAGYYKALIKKSCRNNAPTEFYG